jgi:hypothetical protein
MDSNIVAKKLLLVIILLITFIVSGCVSNDCQKTPYVACKTVSIKVPKVEQQCASVEVPHSWKEAVIDDDFSFELGRFLQSSVVIRNTDINYSGLWLVRFSYTTLTDGTTIVDVNQFIAPGEEKAFTAQYDLAFSEEYRAEYEIISPTKEVCEYYLRYDENEMESCLSEVQYKNTCK